MKVTIRPEDSSPEVRKHRKILSGKYNYRIEHVRNCGNCAHCKSGPDQGDRICPKLGNRYVDYRWICDLHENPPEQPTPKEIALSKLNSEDKKALGL